MDYVITPLICKSFNHNFIDAEIVVDQHARVMVYLLIIPLCPSEDNMFIPIQARKKIISNSIMFCDDNP